MKKYTLEMILKDDNAMADIVQKAKDASPIKHALALAFVSYAKSGGKIKDLAPFLNFTHTT